MNDHEVRRKACQNQFYLDIKVQDLNRQDRILIALAVCTGSFFYLYLMSDGFSAWLLPTDDLALAYNYYFHALLNGDLNVPLRIIGREGHYSPDGRAFIYYGIFPALLRVFAYPFLDLTRDSFAPTSVFLAALSISMLTQQIAVTASRSALPPVGIRRSIALAGLLLSCWLCSPGLFLAANAAVYHEPIAWALAACLGSIALFQRNQTVDAQVLLPFSVLVFVAIHSRPHFGLGLCFVFAVLALFIVAKTFRPAWRLPMQPLQSRADWACLTFASVIAVSAGILYLWLNAARFGSVGSFHAEATTQIMYGYVFLGPDTPETARHVGIAEFGRFHQLRIIPNAIFYAVGGWSFHDRLIDMLGLINVKKAVPAPYFLLTFGPWVALASGLALRKIKTGLPVLAPQSVAMGLFFLAAAFAGFMVLAFSTITFRYSLEIWLPLFVLAIFLLQRSSKHTRFTPGKWFYCFAALAVCGISVFNVDRALAYRTGFAGPPFMPRENCLKILKEEAVVKQLDPALCALPNFEIEDLR